MKCSLDLFIDCFFAVKRKERKQLAGLYVLCLNAKCYMNSVIN